MIKLKKYYTFKELLECILTGESLTNYYAGFKAAQANSGDPLLSAQTYNNKFEDVFNEAILSYGDWGVLWKSWVPVLEEEPDDLDYTEDKNQILRVLTKFASIYNKTQEKYLLLLGIYQDNKTKLLNKVTSDTTTRYNDTPQNGGDWSDDEHTSNITQIKNEADLTPLIERIKEISIKYDNLLKDWVNEFKGIFITPEVYYE